MVADILTALLVVTVIGVIAGAAIGWLIDEFGDAIIDWVVGWFD